MNSANEFIAGRLADDSSLLPTEAAVIAPAEYHNRIVTLRENMQMADIDALLLVAGSNMRYFTGLTWALTERLVGAVITQTDTIFICPAFEESAMKPVLKVSGDFAYWQEDEDPNIMVGEIVKKCGADKVAIDAKCPLWLYERLNQSISQNSHCELVSATELMAAQRARKSATELALMQKAMDTTLSVHKLVYEYMQPGMPASELIRFIDTAHRHFGADNGSYFCAVQFDEGTSHPHGVPGDPVLQDNSLVLIDTGCQFDGYHSDITRTYGLGSQPQQVQELWLLEKLAQAVAFEMVRPGVSCEEIDNAARDVLVQHGLGPDYNLPGLPHRTGHGIGLEIHEGPYLVRGDKTKLQPGMCFSNEPMIVVPGQFGIRLEDHFYVTEQRAQWFTQPQHSLLKPFG